ncbi:MAG: thioredoxin [Lentisphaeria bacterium]
MGAAKNLTNENFQETITSGITLVDFWATWCGPCRMLTPVIDELAEEFAGRANICKVNCDEARDIAIEYGVTSITAIFIIKDGEVVERFTGVQAKGDLVSAITKHL